LKRVQVPEFIKRNSENKNFFSTVGTKISAVLPRGTRSTSAKTRSYKQSPTVPADIFAVSGVLLQDSGAFAFHGVNTSKSHLNYPKLGLSATRVEELEKLGKTWANAPKQIPKEIRDLWNELESYWEFPLNVRAYKNSARRIKNNQYWWRAAYELFLVADAACQGIGFTPFDEAETTIAQEFWDSRIHLISAHRRGRSSSDGIKNVEIPSTITQMVDPDVICVQPKSLIPTVGAGTRVFSRNLCLLPPRGVVRTQWSVNTHRRAASADPGLNILAIPFPYKMERDEFVVDEVKDEANRRAVKVFRLKQTWLLDGPFREFKLTCESLFDQCKARDNLHGLVLPELSLNQDRFVEFAEFAKRRIPELEFIVSGTSQNCEKQPKSGNYIWIRKFKAAVDGKHSSLDSYFDISQSKHHRWSLDEGQILAYGLHHTKAGGMAIKEPHWENFAGRPRELNFLAFRENSAFCGVVCEDLARSEPCHEVIRAVGPNLLFALLLDGPQIEPRWGAKYASIFAADHGCAVMTVSSRALVQRSQEVTDLEKNYSVVYFRSPSMPTPAAIECKEANSGVFIRLMPANSTTSHRRQLIDWREKPATDWVIHSNFPPKVIKA
jgi:hypothetical protein